ncbi:MAG: DUF4250 domain-containing protein [Clostridiales bacterium]|nr:DUF4250 domain-containing protein [Clostridiales bacterium]
MNLPKDPIILLSYVNTQLRDNYPTLSDFVNSQNIDIKDLTDKLNSINYFYDKKTNKFI